MDLHRGRSSSGGSLEGSLILVILVSGRLFVLEKMLAGTRGGSA